MVKDECTVQTIANELAMSNGLITLSSYFEIQNQTFTEWVQGERRCGLEADEQVSMMRKERQTKLALSENKSRTNTKEDKTDSCSHDMIHQEVKKGSHPSWVFAFGAHFLKPCRSTLSTC